MTNWYCVRSATRMERRAETALRELGVTVYLPCETRPWRHARAYEKRYYPLLPGYLFAKLSAADIYPAANADGVHKIMGVGRARSDITDYDIAWLRFSEFMGAFDRDPWIPPPMFVPGKPIVVSSGKLKGALGEIVRAKGQNRMEVLLTAFGRTKRYELPIAELSAA